jgi:hypothetical protein
MTRTVKVTDDGRHGCVKLSTRAKQKHRLEGHALTRSQPRFSSNWNDFRRARFILPSRGGISPVKILAALSRFVYRPEPPAPSAAPFDDGLVEIARLIAREEPVRDGAEARRSRSSA